MRSGASGTRTTRVLTLSKKVRQRFSFVPKENKQTNQERSHGSRQPNFTNAFEMLYLKVIVKLFRRSTESAKEIIGPLEASGPSTRDLKSLH